MVRGVARDDEILFGTDWTIMGHARVPGRRTDSSEREIRRFDVVVKKRAHLSASDETIAVE